MPSRPEFVKFDWEQISEKGPKPQDTAYIRAVCNKLSDYDLLSSYQNTEVSGSNGNVSYRLKPNGTFVITATQLPSKRNLNPKDFVTVDRYEVPTEPGNPGKAFYRGSKLPSSESILHWHFYSANPTIGGIIHAHADTELLYRSRDLWKELGIVETERVGEEGTLDLPLSVQEVLRQPNHYVVLKDHSPSWDSTHVGVLVMGENLLDATEEIMHVQNRLLEARRTYLVTN